ncbi:hypothetical protein CKAN_01556100 [Cinnamomum micranthum f. kanehirae]|uniref:Uncharacterized protein n=1 Tax=Cinnamomum micranthum f. kanehirae TaxID=337451 RepID=A0A3S3NU80_9MAGN|nr:hypothetical protein CKAN_01556100 [Cinnamomum micranthum f. kanehirae]
MESTEEVKPSFVARFGKLFFHGRDAVELSVFDMRSPLVDYDRKTRESMGNKKYCDNGTALPRVSEEGLSCLGVFINHLKKHSAYSALMGKSLMLTWYMIRVQQHSWFLNLCIPENYLSHARGLDYNLGYCAQVRRHAFIELGRI